MAWDKTKPSGTDAIKDSDDMIRANWAALDTVLTSLIAGAAEITATAAEINAALDGITAGYAELNKLDGASANVTATNLNTLTAGTASVGDSLHKHANAAQLTSGTLPAARIGSEAIIVTRLKLTTGSYSEDITNATKGTRFTTNKYAHQIEVKGENIKVQMIEDEKWSVTTSWVAFSYRFYNSDTIFTYGAYAQWSYHTASEQGIWGIWDKDQNRLTCILVEEAGKNGGRLSRPESDRKILVEFKNPKKYEGKTAEEISKMNIPFSEVKEV